MVCHCGKILKCMTPPMFTRVTKMSISPILPLNFQLESVKLEKGRWDKKRRKLA